MTKQETKTRQEQLYRQIAVLATHLSHTGRTMRADELLDWINTKYPELNYGGTRRVLYAAHNRAKSDEEVEALEIVFRGKDGRPLLK